MHKSKFILSNYAKVTNLKTSKKCGNASYLYINNEKLLITRETNYVYGNKFDGTTYMYRELDSHNILRSNEALYLVTSDTIKFKKYITESKGGDWGFEDPRVFYINSVPYIEFTRRNPKQTNKFEVNCGKLDSNLNYVNNIVIPGKTNVEKNWQPIPDNSGRFIYSVQPFQTISYGTGELQSISNNFPLLIRGSTNLVQYNGNYLAINHIRNEDFEYLHFVVEYDKDLRLVRISDPFSFMGMPVEFTCYLEYRDGVFTALVSIHDQVLYEFVITDAIMNAILTNRCNSRQRTYTADDIIKDAVTNNNIPAACVLSTYSNNTNTIMQSIMLNHKSRYFRDPDRETLGLSLYKRLAKLKR